LQSLDVAHYAVEMGAHANPLVGLGRGAIDRDMQAGEPARRAQLGPPVVEQGQVGVGADADAAPRGVGHHIEEAGVHHRLAQPLQM